MHAQIFSPCRDCLTGMRPSITCVEAFCQRANERGGHWGGEGEGGGRRRAQVTRLYFITSQGSPSAVQIRPGSPRQQGGSKRRVRARPIKQGTVHPRSSPLPEQKTRDSLMALSVGGARPWRMW